MISCQFQKRELSIREMEKEPANERASNYKMHFDSFSTSKEFVPLFFCCSFMKNMRKISGIFFRFLATHQIQI